MPEEEKRIYVVIADQFTHRGFYNNDITAPYFYEGSHPAGRLAAQVGHVVSKMRTMEIIESLIEPKDFEPITTIVLSARNAKEIEMLYKIMLFVLGKGEIFYDTNDADYGKDMKNATAVCTYPVFKHAVEGILDHLPLWDPKINLRAR